MSRTSEVRTPVRSWAALALLCMIAVACSGGGGGGGGGGTNTNPVNRVDVTGPSNTLEINQTVQLAAAPFTAQGPATGKTVSWSSTDAAVAQVSGSGLVTGMSAGAATIRATVDGITGTFAVTVTAIPVASVALVRDTATLVAGGGLTLQASARTAGGAVIPTAVVTWSTLDPGVAGVSGTGAVNALAPGSARIVASSGGKSDTAAVTVVSRTAVSLRLTPVFAIANIGAPTMIGLEVLTASGLPVPAPAVNWQALDGGTVNPNGNFATSVPGSYRIAATVDAQSDTAVVAVLGTGLLATVWPGAALRAEVAPGAAVSVPVRLDMSRLSANGDLGAFQVEVEYDPAVLQYIAHTQDAAGTLDVNSATPGLLRVAFAHTAPQAASVFTLLTLNFQAAPGAPAGSRSGLRARSTAKPATTGLAEIPVEVVVGGSVRVVAP